MSVIQSAITMVAYGDRMRRRRVDVAAVAAYWIDRIYALAGLPMTPEERAELEAHLERHRRGRHGQVIYDLKGDFGIDPAELRRRFEFYFDRFPVRAES
jgi:hypothetical protein